MPRTMLDTVHTLLHFIITTTPSGGHYCYSYCREEKAEAKIRLLANGTSGEESVDSGITLCATN